MEFIMHDSGETRIAELKKSSAIVIGIDEVMDLIGNADYQGARKVMIHADQLPPEFFDLKTGIAGEILQKFSNYRMQLAIVGDFREVSSKALRDFIFESNKRRQICFAGSVEEGLELLD